jgi:hypothetical protein
VAIQSRAPGTIHLKVDGIPVSLIEYRYPQLVSPEHCAGLPVPVTRKYPVEDIGHVVRSLAYFGDATGPLPAGLSSVHWQQIQRDFETWVRALMLSESG